MILVGLLDEEHIQDNKRAFQLIDSDHSGTVSQQEMREAIELINMHHPEVNL